MSNILEVLQSLYTQTVILESFLGLDNYGESRYDQPVIYRARIQQRAKLVRTAQGEAVVANTQVYLYPTPPVLTARDRITLPAPFTPTQPPILSIQQSPDAEGVISCSVLC